MAARAAVIRVVLQIDAVRAAVRDDLASARPETRAVACAGPYTRCALITKYLIAGFRKRARVPGVAREHVTRIASGPHGVPDARDPLAGRHLGIQLHLDSEPDLSIVEDSQR